MDKIYINDLEFIGNHGVFPEEKILGQKFLISVILETSTREAGVSGDLTSSTHYGYVADDIEKVFFSKSFDLIESLAEEIAKAILNNYSLISAVIVKVCKPWAPIKKHFSSVAVEIKRRRNIVYLSLGTNIGNLEKNLNNALKEIAALATTRILKVSDFVITKPFGFIEQDDFLNGCVKVETLLTPKELLKEILEIEKRMGRIRKERWGPRVIDIDILFFNDEIIQDDELAIPHPWISQRDFVLTPLMQIAPNLVHPLKKKTITLLKYFLDNKES